MVRRTTRPVVEQSTLARITSWQGLRPLDEVRVKGKPGQRRRYEFLAFVQNTETGECAIEVVGGRLERDGSFQRNIRTFPPERCSPPPRRRQRQSVLDDDVVQMSFDDLLGEQRSGA